MQPTRLFDLLEYQLEKYNLDKALVTKINGEWIPTSTKEFIERSDELANKLIDLGVNPKDHIAVISTQNRTTWNVLDMALQKVGAVMVPMYPTISQKDYEYIFNDANIRMAFISDDALADRVKPLIDLVDSLESIYSFDPIDGLKTIKDLLADNSTDHSAELDKRKAAIDPHDPVTMIYTSGTTGDPKGVQLTHNNILCNVQHSVGRFEPQDMVALSMLPSCHIFERMVQYIYLHEGTSIYFAESIDAVKENLQEVRPQVMTVVPRVLEKFYAAIINKGKELSGIKKALFFWAVRLTSKYENEWSLKGLYKFKLNIARKIIFSKWKAGLGGNIEVLVTGSAALSPDILRTFCAAGIPILEGYGLTETSPVVTVNAFREGYFKIGSVGKPLENLDVKISSEGEILVKGPSVLGGYYNKPEKTKEAFTEDGYFRTGDIGEIDSEGILKITDRMKELLKTSGGKYIAPQPIENELKQSLFIEQAMVVGDGKKMPVVLIQPDFEFLKQWLERKHKNIDTNDLEAVCNHPDIIKRYYQEVNEVNKHLGSWEQLKKLALVPVQWSVENDMLTPTLKLKRKKVYAAFESTIDGMYQD